MVLKLDTAEPSRIVSFFLSIFSAYLTTPFIAAGKRIFDIQIISIMTYKGRNYLTQLGPVMESSSF
jgi:hypothetical protein